MQIPILYHDAQLLVVNKPPGIAVEPHREARGDSLIELLLLSMPALRGNAILQNIHRLDKAVSGVLILALRAQALKRLNTSIAAREVTKTYLAVITSRHALHAQRLEHWIVKDNANKKAIIHDTQVIDSLPVSLSYQVLATKGEQHLLRIDLHTGRYHQIRAQLAHIGCPILGDIKYGSSSIYLQDSIALHSHHYGIAHPTTRAINTYTAPLPINAVWDRFKGII